MTFTIDQYRLDGKVAVVTGGRGRARRTASAGRHALGLAAAGAAVVVADINAEEAPRAVADEIKAAGRAGDCGRSRHHRPGVGRCPGAGGEGSLRRRRHPGQQRRPDDGDRALSGHADLLLEDWNKAFAVNVTGALNCAQAMAPMMIERGGGKIVNQVSGGAFPASTVYGVTKIALVGLARPPWPASWAGRRSASTRSRRETP